jgi:hypothetical protein
MSLILVEASSFPLINHEPANFSKSKVSRSNGFSRLFFSLNWLFMTIRATEAATTFESVIY